MGAGLPTCLPLSTMHRNSQGSLSSRQDPGAGPSASVKGGNQRHKALHPTAGPGSPRT